MPAACVVPRPATSRSTSPRCKGSSRDLNCLATSEIATIRPRSGRTNTPLIRLRGADQEAHARREPGEAGKAAFAGEDSPSAFSGSLPIPRPAAIGLHPEVGADVSGSLCPVPTNEVVSRRTVQEYGIEGGRRHTNPKASSCAQDAPAGHFGAGQS